MNKDLLLSNLSSSDIQERTKAARSLKGMVSEGDRDRLYVALSNEKNPWVKHAISDLLKELADDKDEPIVEVEVSDFDLHEVEAIKRDARADSIGQILHELEPIVGDVNLLAREAVDDFDSSPLRSELEMLDHLLETFESWKKVEQHPKFNVVDISKTLEHIVETSQKKYSGVTFDLVVENGLVFNTDRGLLKIILTNAIRNSVEAILKKGDGLPGYIVVSCGIMNSSLWGTVVDNGVGLPEGKNFYKHEFTTKPGHQGRGLTTLSQAINSLGGDWKLQPDSAGGAKFYFQLMLVDS